MFFLGCQPIPSLIATCKDLEKRWRFAWAGRAWSRLGTGTKLAPQLSNSFPQLLVTGMGVHDRRQWAYVPRESLGEEKVAG